MSSKGKIWFVLTNVVKLVKTSLTLGWHVAKCSCVKLIGTVQKHTKKHIYNIAITLWTPVLSSWQEGKNQLIIVEWFPEISSFSIAQDIEWINPICTTKKHLISCWRIICRNVFDGILGNHTGITLLATNV